jgi:hypothetical protein
VLDVPPEGSLEVTEAFHLRFEGVPFSYAFRELAYTQINEIERLQVARMART